MTISLGQNINSLRGQRHLGQATGELRSVFERLSSGQRINKASDDAAGLAIADTLRTDARLYTQGIRNANDAISMHTIADAALAELSGIVTRIQELAEQSANGVYSRKQRLALNEEAQALRDEYQRITESTEFSGVKLLDGSARGMHMQIGIDGGADSLLTVGFEEGATRIVGDGTFEISQTIGISSSVWFGLAVGDTNNDGINDILTSPLGSLRTYLGSEGGTFDSSVVTGSFHDYNRVKLLEDFDLDGNLDVVGSDDAQIMWGDGDGSFTDGGPLVGNGTSVAIGDVNNDGLVDIISGDGATNDITLLLNNGDRTFSSQVVATGTGETSGLTIGDMNNDGNLDIIVQEKNSFQLNIYSGDGSGGFNLLSSTANNVGTSGSTNSVGDFNGDGNLDVAINLYAGTKIYTGDGNGNLTNTFSLGGTPYFNTTVTDFNDDGFDDLAIKDSVYLYNEQQGTFVQTESFTLSAANEHFSAAGDLNQDGVADLVILDQTDKEIRVYNQNTTTAATLDTVDLTTQKSAQETLDKMQSRLDILSSRRGDIGAALSRIEVAINVQSVASQNYLAAESRIRDADIAVEGAALARLNILQQAASSVLAQANQQPALAVQLLS